MVNSDEDDFDPERRHEREVAGQLATERSEFVSLMQHFYRGELGRVTAWRGRLDKTTNWAVGLMASLITWAFSAPDHPHYIILGSLVVVTVFLFVEARRYRIFDLWRSRVRLVEENIFANAADPEGVVHERWRTMLAEDLREPTIKVPFLEALVRRLRRVYFPMITIIVASWLFRVAVFGPTDIGVLEAAAIDPIPGSVVIGGVLLFYLVMAGLTAWPIDRLAKGEKRLPSERDDEWREK
ncbi:DUF2270 domain-containing protein [Halobacteria archaeon AArc-curdl1]|uniref:DUF2270 domain-containing protein n=1 Tax=Natronosalvus hydrolyticus TaxID=2979988 RepID=A0AAP2Z4A6_9EURY|nr:DUF2270 domain-containing protein [Halobacteria archaeon AArc-curdl1]